MRNANKLIVKAAMIIGAAAGYYGLKYMSNGKTSKVNENDKDFKSQPREVPSSFEKDNKENSFTTKTAAGYTITPTFTNNSNQHTDEDKLNLNDISDTDTRIDVEW